MSETNTSAGGDAPRAPGGITPAGSAPPREGMSVAQGVAALRQVRAPEPAPGPRQATQFQPAGPAAAAPEGMTQKKGLEALRAARPQPQEQAPQQAQQAEPQAPQEQPQEPQGEPQAQQEQPQGEQAPQADEPRFRVKVNGEEIEVTQAELLAGYSREADYRTKTQKVAEERRATEAVATQVAQVQQRAIDALAVAEEIQRRALGPEPDWDRLAAEDPARYLGEERRWGQLQAIQAQRQALQAEAAQAQQVQLAQRVKAETDRLFEKIPAIKDKEAFKTWRGEMRTYGMEMGFTEAEIQQAYDHRLLVLLDKAYRYDKAMKAQPVQAAARPAAAPVLQPGAAAPRALHGAAAGSHGLKQAAESFAAKPSKQAALDLLRARRSAPRR